MKKKNQKNLSLKPFKVGEKIVEFGQVYRIFKIGQESGGRKIYYKPYYKTERDQDVVCSIPESSVSLTNIRRPVSKKEIISIVRDLAFKKGSLPSDNFDLANEKLGQNSPALTAKVLKELTLDQRDGSTAFTVNRRKAIQLARDRLLEEVAFVLGIPIKEAGFRVNQELTKLKDSLEQV